MALLNANKYICELYSFLKQIVDYGSVFESNELPKADDKLPDFFSAISRGIQEINNKRSVSNEAIPKSTLNSLNKMNQLLDDIENQQDKLPDSVPIRNNSETMVSEKIDISLERISDSMLFEQLPKDVSSASRNEDLMKDF